MRVNSQDQTIKKNYIQKYRFLIREYQEMKAYGTGRNNVFHHGTDFYFFP